jgi:hypothetical protein
VPRRPGKDDTILTFTIKDESRAAVAPYPFDIDPLIVSFQGRLIPKRRYASQDEFLLTYYGAEKLAINYLLSSN